MSQSSITIWALLALFFVFITVRGELPAYMGVFIGSSAGGGSASSTQTTSSGNLSGLLPGQFGAGIGVTQSQLAQISSDQISSNPFYVPGTDVPIVGI